MGKTSLMNRFVSNQFQEEYISTIGVNIMIKDLQVENQKVQLSIWDVGGREKFSRIKRMYYAGSKAALVIFDLTRPRTYGAVTNFVKEYLEVIPKEAATLILVGNKVDLENNKKIEFDEGNRMKSRINAMNYFETSAKTGYLVEETFRNIAVALLKQGL